MNVHDYWVLTIAGLCIWAILEDDSFAYSVCSTAVAACVIYLIFRLGAVYG